MPLPKIKADYGKALLNGEGEAIAAYVQAGKRIPRRCAPPPPPPQSALTPIRASTKRQGFAGVREGESALAWESRRGNRGLLLDGRLTLLLVTCMA